MQKDLETQNRVAKDALAQVDKIAERFEKEKKLVQLEAD
jgi:hypothetical protein